METRMKQARKFKKMTLKEVAELVGVTESAVSKYECNRAIPSDAVIRLFCEKLRISESWLRTGEGEMEDRDVISDLIATYNLGPAGQAFMRAIGRILYELGEDACNKVIEDVLAELQVGVANRQSASVSLPQAPAEEEDSSSASSGSVVG